MHEDLGLGVYGVRFRVQASGCGLRLGVEGYRHAGSYGAKVSEVFLFSVLHCPNLKPKDPSARVVFS